MSMLDLSSSQQSEARSAVQQGKNVVRDNLQFVDTVPSGSSSSSLATSIQFGSNVLGPENHNNPQSQSSNNPRTVDPGTLAFGSNLTPQFLKTARHPVACIFHLAFKALALMSFLFGSFLFGGWEGDFVFTFVITTILLSIDFWIVKNITGRLLVGMRWWNEVLENGSNEWIFEAHTDEQTINRTDKVVFWTGVYCWPLFWTGLLLVHLLRLNIEWVLLVSIGLSLSAANLIGYWKCSSETKRQVQSWATSKAFNMIFGRFI